MTNPSSADERALFESVAEGFTFHCAGGNEYINAATRNAYEGFKLGRASLGAAQVPSLSKTPGMAVQALAGEIIRALLADEKDGGYDLTAGMFGTQFSRLVRRWADAEWAALSQPSQQEAK